MSSLTMNSYTSLSDVPVDAGFTTFFWHLFTKEKYTDIYFNVEYGDSPPVTFSAHKFVLALRSPYFAEEFYKVEKEVDNVILLTDVNPEAFKHVLRFMYDWIAPIQTAKMLCEVYKVTEKFKVVSLMKYCCQCLKDMKISASNIFDLLEAADYVEDIKTKDNCLKFIQENTKEVMKSYKFSEITPFMICIFLSLKTMSLDSVSDLFDWVFRWAQSRVSENSDCNTIRKAIEEFLPQLPFASLSYNQFAELYKSYKDAFEDSEVISIFMNLAIPGSQRLPDWYNEKQRIEMESRRSE